MTYEDNEIAMTVDGEEFFFVLSDEKYESLKDKLDNLVEVYMDYQQYGHDSDGKKVESRRTRKWDRNKIFAANKSANSKSNKRARREQEQ